MSSNVIHLPLPERRIPKKLPARLSADECELLRHFAEFSPYLREKLLNTMRKMNGYPTQ